MALVPDVMMPLASGKDVYDSIVELDPKVKTIFMTGYSADSLDKQGFGDAIPCIFKPIKQTCSSPRYEKNWTKKRSFKSSRVRVFKVKPTKKAGRQISPGFSRSRMEQPSTTRSFFAVLVSLAFGF